jgi:hypothetical protein
MSALIKNAASYRPAPLPGMVEIEHDGCIEMLTPETLRMLVEQSSAWQGCYRTESEFKQQLGIYQGALDFWEGRQG